MDIRDLSSKAKMLEELSTELEEAYQDEIKLQLLQKYKDEFSGFLDDFLRYYNSNVKDISSFVESVAVQKDKKIEELQESVNSLTKKLMEEKHTHELQMEHLSYIAHHEPEKAITFLSNLYLEHVKNKKYIS